MKKAVTMEELVSLRKEINEGQEKLRQLMNAEFPSSPEELVKCELELARVERHTGMLTEEYRNKVLAYVEQEAAK